MKTARMLPRRPWSMAGRVVAGLLAWALLFPTPWRSDSRAGGPAARPGLATVSNSSTPDTDGPAYDPDPKGTRNRIFEAYGVKAWHAQGYRGQGVKVAILDSGFCGYRSHLGQALPSRVQTRSFRLDGDLEAKDSQHGILCAEVVHALAPEAELLLANWEPERPEQFLAAVAWARAEGARVLTCSVIMPTWSDYEGHGPVHEALTRLLGPGHRASDRLLFASAGNTALRHWSGSFHPAWDGCHEWAPGQTENWIKPWDGERVSVELCCEPGARFDLAVYDRTVNILVGRSRVPNRELLPPGECRCAVVGFTSQPNHVYSVQVRRVQAPASGTGRFHLVVLGGSLHHATRQGSICFPGDGPEVVAVGAVDSMGHRVAYSSCGPDSSRPKPDLVAPVPFPSLWRTRPFTGTSAAAPQAAALAALVWSRHPHWTAWQVRTTLQQAACHPGPARHDGETGYGQIHLPF
jgi:hypothetical protein